MMKKIVAVLMILMIISTDFFLLGSNIISYAVESSNSNLNTVTNNKNIEFSTYFKNAKGEKVDSFQTSIKTEKLKLYAEITVKNEGYLTNTVLELQNSNFKIKNTILSNLIASIDGNKVTLKQINAGTTAVIELDIEQSINDTLTQDMLAKESGLKLTGTYMETSYKGLKIEAVKNVTLNLQPDESASAELETDIITNKIFSINGTNKRMLQILAKSRLSDNQYPIKQTTINVDVPVFGDKKPEKVEVVSLGTMATNGKTELKEENWKNENGKVTITLKNEDDEIRWNKNSYDKVVVTFIYDESVDTSKINITSNSEITVYNSDKKYTTTNTKEIENQELNGIITTDSEISSSGIYKGQISSNVSAQYNTKTILSLTNADIPEKVMITETPDVLTTETNELTVNTKYVSTKINKEKMLEILGQDGSVSIKSGSTTALINKDSEADKNGDVLINYQNPSNELKLETSKPEKAGILEINHTKVVTENSYEQQELNMVKTLKTKNTVQGTADVDNVEKEIAENSSESSLEVKDTVSKAEFIAKKDALSTMTTNKDVTLGVKLVTDGVQYDLYKNPIIKIQLPSSVESIKVNEAKALYADDFTVSPTYDKTNKTIEMKLNGEQKLHPETSATQLYLQLNLDITLSKLAPSKTDKFVMTYTNENAIQYDGGTTDAGVIEKNIEISAPSGLVTMNNASTYNVTGIKGINEEKQLVQIPNEDAGKDINMNIALVNNTGENAKNVRIFGKLPTSGNKTTAEETTNTLETTLKNISAQNSTVYYSENSNAGTDLNDSANGWTTTLSPNSKVFLIVLATLNTETNYTATYTVQLPNPIQKDAMSYTEYDVIYDTESNKNITTKSSAIGFATPTELKLDTNITAQVGNDTINNGDTIKAGEVIKYTMSVKNNGAQELKNIELKSNVPDGTVYVTPEANYQHSGISYYTENADIKEVKEVIPSLGVGATYTKTYEVRAKSDLTAEKQITNKTIAVYEGDSKESEELTNKIVKSNIRVTIKKLVEESNVLISGGTMEYMMFVENLTDQDISNLELQLISNNFKISCLSNGDDLYLMKDEIPEKISIDKISAKGNVWFKLEGDTVENAEQVTATAVVKDSNGDTYRSNKLEENLQKIDAKITLTSPQNKAYIREGDFVEYDIDVMNTGNIEENIEIADSIPEYLEVQAIYVNGELKSQTTETAETSTYVANISNNVSYVVTVGAGDKATIKIIAIVKNITEDIDAKTIMNKAEAKINQMTKATSEEVTHILKVTSENIKNVISGKAWLDKNLNGAKDSDEPVLSDIKVKIYDINTNNYLKNDNGDIIQTTTNENGEYTFTKIPNGEYIVLFEYDTNEYEPTYYMKDGIDDSLNSKAVFKNITIGGEDKNYAVTDTIDLDDSVSNVNIGLKEKLIFDLQLDKYISKISIQNSNGTKTYDYNNSTFEKVEIHRKQIAGSVVVLEYTIKVKNNGEITGYTNNIVDYLSNGLAFSSELNPDWYLSGNQLYTKKFANEAINPGEEKEVKLVLTKTMTNENTGVVNNRAEIVEDYNEYGVSDINSTPNNNISGENDMGSADVIIGISTGGTIIAYVILAMINTGLIIIAIRLMIKNKIIRINRKRR